MAEFVQMPRSDILAFKSFKQVCCFMLRLDAQWRHKNVREPKLRKRGLSRDRNPAQSVFD